MSLQTAACGFGVWCKNNNIVFNVPYIGRIAIGADFVAVLSGFEQTCQCKVTKTFEQNGRVTVFKVGDTEILRYSVIGSYIQSFSFQGVAQQIPMQYIYTYGKNKYLSNICVDGYMIWIKNINEIKLKQVNDVPCQIVTLQQLGLNVKNASKTSIHTSLASKNHTASDNRKAGVVTSNAVSNNLVSQQDYSDLTSRKAELLNKFDSLRNEIFNLNQECKSMLGNFLALQEEEEKVDAEHDKLCKELRKTYNREASTGYSLHDLIYIGVLKDSNDGTVILAKDSDSKRAVKDIDSAFNVAKDWVESREYREAYKNCMKMWNRLNKLAMDKNTAFAKYTNTIRSKEYVEKAGRLSNLRYEFEKVRCDIEYIDKKLNGR